MCHMILNKFAGFGISFFSTMLLFILFKVIVHDEVEFGKIYKAILFLIPYVLVFLIIAALLTLVLDILQFKNKIYDFFGHILVGIFVAGVIIADVYEYSSELSAYVLVSCIVGSILFYLVSFIENRFILYMFSTVPVIFILLYLFV
jgi:uncharacterized membrane protein YeaQ/YmgE (transglycosylase-associated protein family)